MKPDKQPLHIDIRSVLYSKSRYWGKHAPEFIINILKRIVHQDELNSILDKTAGTEGAGFAGKILENLNVECSPIYKNKPAIKNDGRYIFVSNHPLGGLDGLALIAEIGKSFGEIKFIVNDFLMFVKPLENLFVPVNKVGKMDVHYINKMEEAYSSNCHILNFPAGLCSRLINGKITDLPWKSSFLKQAVKYNREVVPVYFGGKNSTFFYKFANLRKRMGIKFNIEMMFLPHEMFKNKEQKFTYVVGEPIKIESFSNARMANEKCAEIRQIAYNLRKLIK